jgi:nucleoside-diphosphate-sugar epimerase
VLRFATAFGLSPRMRFDLTISQFVREVCQGNELLVYDPDTWRPYCHVQDFADVAGRVLAAPAEDVFFEVFNAGGDVNNFTKRMIVDEIVKRLPDARIRYQEQGSDPRNYRVDFAKISSRLGFTPRNTVQSGIEELIEAFDRHLFDRVDGRRNFHGNYEIAYP